MRYPLPVTAEEVAVGNPGYRPLRQRATWKGDTVVRMEPLDAELATCYSDFDKQEVPVFYGTDGPGPLYQREHMRDDTPPTPAPLTLDDGGLDLWTVGATRAEWGEAIR